MDLAKAAGWLITGLFILFALWVGSLMLGVGLSLIGALLSVISAVVGAFVSLLFSENILTLAAVGLVAYVIWNRKKPESSCYHGYHY